jgi:hypothetical protein
VLLNESINEKYLERIEKETPMINFKVRTQYASIRGSEPPVENRTWDLTNTTPRQ